MSEIEYCECLGCGFEFLSTDHEFDRDIELCSPCEKELDGERECPNTYECTDYTWVIKD